MKIKFREIKMNHANKARLETVNGIIEEYQAKGYTLTLRQLYYQLVSRGVVPNKQAEYSKLSILLREGRMGGIVDWSAIEDRLRKPESPSSWNNPKELIDAAASQFALPRQEGQPLYVEVWVEKDALSGVLRRVTEKYHIPILVNRGYSSASAMYNAFKRFDRANNAGQEIKVLYLGDFDPSGIDMIRDISDRITEFIGEENRYDFNIEGIALTRAQIKQYNPPPNPAKITDPRAAEFIKKHGSQSWEVDALKPEILNKLLEDKILENIDLDLYKEIVKKEAKEKAKLLSLKKYL